MTAQSKNLKTEVSRGIKGFRLEGPTRSTMQEIQSNKNFGNFNKSNYLTVDATTIEVPNSSPTGGINKAGGRLPIQHGLFSSLDQSTETIGGPSLMMPIVATPPTMDNSKSILIQGAADISTLSKKSLVSIIDLKKNNEFENVK